MKVMPKPTQLLKMLERINMPKKRKPRTTGYNIYFDGAHINGRPILHESRAIDKIEYRYKNNLCLGCGKKECTCKSKMED